MKSYIARGMISVEQLGRKQTHLDILCILCVCTCMCVCVCVEEIHLGRCVVLMCVFVVMCVGGWVFVVCVCV